MNWSADPGDSTDGRVEPATSASFEHFYSEAWADAARWGYGLTGDAAAGEELAQEAFVAIHGRFASVVNPHAYLRRMVVNLARGHHRSRIRRDRPISRQARPRCASYGTGERA